MEKVTINKMESQNTTTTGTLTLVNRQNLSLNGVKNVISSNVSNIILMLNNTKLNIEGENLFIQKLDLENGNVEIDGKINCLNYGKTSFIKRLFK